MRLESWAEPGFRRSPVGALLELILLRISAVDILYPTVPDVRIGRIVTIATFRTYANMVTV